jgi:hypothetical protein
VHEDPLIVHLTIDGELANGDWVPAAALEIDSQVQRANGTTGIVEAIEFIHNSQLMYNLTVAAAHTYFVGEGQWLVHNTCKWLGSGTVPRFGEDLANLADNIHSQVGQFWPRRNSTTAVSEVNGRIYVSSFGDARAVDELKALADQRGYTFVPNNGEHAEIALFRRLQNESGFNGIGVSHYSGPCANCRSFFSKVGFENVFWTGTFNP